MVEGNALEELNSLISQQEWDKANELRVVSPSYVAQHHFLYLISHPTQLSPALINGLFAQIEDKEWVARAALQAVKLSNDTNAVGALLTLGVEATDTGLAAKEKVINLKVQGVTDDTRAEWLELTSSDESLSSLVGTRRELLELQDRRRTWIDMCGEDDDGLEQGRTSDEPRDEEGEEEEDEEEDPWGVEEGLEVEQSDHSKGIDIPPIPSTASRPSLHHFLTTSLLESAYSLAASSSLPALVTLCLYHSDSLWPHRFDILDSIPEWEAPIGYLELLPRCGPNDFELAWKQKSWRDKDWIEAYNTTPPSLESAAKPLSTAELTNYYTNRINTISDLGLVGVALSLVQNCAALGISGLDEIGEELSLLSKLVYDRPPLPPGAPSSDDILSLSHWRSLSSASILRAYLAHSSPETVASDIRRLALPYLSVLESRLERAGTPDPALPNRLLYGYILELASTNKLPLLVSVFENSKPTMPKGSRVIKTDDDVAKLALAVLYGSSDTSSDGLVFMSQIFECLPAFEAGEDEVPSDDNLFHHFPSGTAPSAITPTSVTEAISTFSLPTLSLALDSLDLHLATAEIFSRYSCAVRLSWFLTSHNDSGVQRGWATRLARTSSTAGGGRADDEGVFESEDEWEGLLEDMVGLCDSEDEDVVKKAFWKLSKEDVLRIFFGGLLAAGKFSLAKKLFYPEDMDPPLHDQIVEELVIAASREFYDNADSGNLNKGDMKLAFDCLTAAPATPAIKKERDFIEATSRLCSFRIYSHPGIPVTPIEIRLSKDRLDFVSRLLTSNEDAYRHPDVVLDLVVKLGYRGDKLAEVRTLAMIADSGLQAGDYERAADVCDRMVDAVEGLRKSKGAEVEDAAEVTWRNCFQLGKHEDFEDVERRMQLLGQALILCPGNKIATLLPVWTVLEDKVTSRASAPQSTPTTARSGRSVGAITIDSASQVTAAAATRTFNRAAAFFPFGKGVVPERSTSPSGNLWEQVERAASPARRSASGGGGGPPTEQTLRDGGEGLRAGFSSLATKGVGWLIGAEAGELD